MDPTAHMSLACIPYDIAGTLMLSIFHTLPPSLDAKPV
jgi:hypothetical protein